jgi:hypothetical protein
MRSHNNLKFKNEVGGRALPLNGAGPGSTAVAQPFSGEQRGIGAALCSHGLAAFFYTLLARARSFWQAWRAWKAWKEDKGF